jgi:hypothetical protein
MAGNYSRVGWGDRTVWIRKREDQVDACCAAGFDEGLLSLYLPPYRLYG